jgi:hypothetical protein
LVEIGQVNVSDSHACHPRWPPFLKIEISSNGQNCSILSRMCPNLNCISIMVSFSACMTGFFMNFVGSVVSEEKIFF